MKNTIIFCAGMLFGASITYLHMKKRMEIEKPIGEEELDIKPPVEEEDYTEEPKSFVDSNPRIDPVPPFSDSKPLYRQAVLYKVDDTEEPVTDHTIPKQVVDTIHKYRGFSQTTGGINYISADEFGEDEDYENITLTYYKDDILADEDDSIISSPNELVGDFKPHFGEEEEDVVYVKNDEVKCYFEIIKDLRKYDEVPRPHRGLLNERYR